MTSFAVKGKYEKKSVAADWTRKKLKDYVVVTNVDEGDVDEAVSLVEPFLDMRKYAIKALGDPFVEGPWQVYVILQGRGLMHIDDEAAEVGPGDAIVIPAGSTQWIDNTGESVLGFLALVNPPWQAGIQTA